MATRLPPTASITVSQTYTLFIFTHLFSHIISDCTKTSTPNVSNHNNVWSIIYNCLLVVTTQRKAFILYSLQKTSQWRSKTNIVSVNTHNPQHCITRFVKTLVYLIWNGHAWDTRPPILPGKRTKLPKQTTESKGYAYVINKGSSWQLWALFFLRLETLESCNVTHTDEKYFYVSLHTAVLPIIYATIKTSKHNTDIITPKLLLSLKQLQYAST